MCRRNIFKVIFIFTIVITFIFITNVYTETLYVDSKNGNDENPGTKERPLRTLEKAAAIVNTGTKGGPTCIKIASGVYNLTKAIVFENDRPYTKESRLLIEATILPDDPDWEPSLIPIILSTEIPSNQSTVFEGQAEISGLKIELNHATIRGLKFLGSPVMQIWYYPIFREGKNLEDLVVTQCLFVMDKNALTSNVAIIANGHGLIVDHCVFYNCRNPVVFWNAEGGTSRGNAMRYCIVDGAYTSGVWICQTSEDFEFHHNIITRSEYVWMRDFENKRQYRLHDCIITENKHYSAKCGPNWEINLTGPEIVYEEENIIKEGKVLLELSNGIDLPVPKHYLHVVPKTLGSDLGAGLFIKKKLIP